MCDTHILKYRKPGQSLSVKVPVSKSIAARLLIIALLSGADPSQLLEGQPLPCEDLQVMQQAVCQIYNLHGKRGHIDVNLRDSGTAKRLLTSLCACTPSLSATLRMSKRLSERPMDDLLKHLAIYSSGIVDCGNSQILKIKGGRFSGIDLLMHYNFRSSQTCSALLLLAPTAASGIQWQLPVTGVSLSYIRMTVRLMQRCGIDAEYEMRTREIHVRPGKYTAPAREMLEGDWSAAAFFYLYALLSGQTVEIQGLNTPADSVQGDAAVAEIFSKLGLQTQFIAGGVKVVPGGKPVEKIDISLRDTPDLVPAVAVGCAMKGVPFMLRGISHLREKESDRLKAILVALNHFGLKVDIGVDSLAMCAKQAPHEPLEALPVFNDHRMAMALAQTAVLWPSVRLDDTDCVKKSFSDFWTQMERLGVQIL